MDILKPKIIHIGRRCYRRNPINFNSSVTYEQEEEFEVPSSSKVTELNTKYEDEPCKFPFLLRYAALTKLLFSACVISKKIEEENDADIQEGTKPGQFRLELSIASAYYGYIIGKNGEQKKRLENDTKASILIPQRNVDGAVILTSDKKSNIISCKNRLFLIVANARQKQQFNHLITFPLTFDEFKKRLRCFKEEVVKTCSSDRGINESVFVNQNKVHLTLGILVLMDNKEKNDATTLLQECNRKYVKQLLNGKPLTVHLKGLEYMNDDPSSVDVLYIKVNSINNDDFIQSISDHIVERFEKSGLMKKQFERVKLHATVMNSLCRVDANDETENDFNENKGGGNKASRESFDARNVLKVFGDYDFGEYTINQLDISVRYTADKNGYYEALSKISF